jgi:hypothetical protein
MSGADFSPTEGSQRRALAAYVIESRGLRPIVTRAKLDRLVTTWVSDDRVTWSAVANGDE